MQTIFMNTKRSKTNKPHKLILNLPQRLKFRQTCCSSKLVHLFHVEKYKKSKLKIIAPTWNYEFESPDGFYSVSDSQDCIEDIVKKYENSSSY